MRYVSPLRYPGGKAKLADFVKSILWANNLLDCAYAEPYAGGAGLALALLTEDYAASVYINDIDPAIHAFWVSVLDKTEDLCRLVRDTPVTPAQWRRQRRIYANGAKQPTLALGFAAFFLNRTNRSGIIDSAGMIGGREQTRWKLNARYNRAELVKRIQQIASYRDRIHLSNLDAIEFLTHAATKLPPRTLVYLDPPYYIKGRQRLYANHYQEQDHAKVAAILRTMSFHWMVSYDEAPTIRRLYRGCRSLTYAIWYTAAERQQGKEVMFFSPNLTVPRKNRPIFSVKRQRKQHT